MRTSEALPPQEELAGFFPDPTQELLLKACLLEKEAVAQAHRRWQALTVIEDLDQASMRLLPMLAWNLNRHGISDPDYSRYLGLQRRAWFRNQVLLRGALSAVSQLQKAGIEALALKGIVLGANTYPSTKHRPMGDIDLLIHRQDRDAALQALKDAGWYPRAKHSRYRRPALLEVQNTEALSRTDQDEIDLDLHWRLLFANPSQEAEQALWSRAVAVELSGVNVKAPDPADMLVHVCGHGARHNEIHPLRWVADAVLICRAHSVDWEHVVAQASRFGLTMPIYLSLLYLRDKFEEDIPGPVIEAIGNSSASSIDRFRFRTLLVSDQERGLLDWLRLHEYLVRRLVKPKFGAVSYLLFLRDMLAGRGRGEIARWFQNRLSALRG